MTSKSINTQLTAESDGYILYQLPWTQSNRSFKLYIQNILVVEEGTNAAYSKLSGMYPISKGWIYKTEVTAGATLYFVPYN